MNITLSQEDIKVAIAEYLKKKFGTKAYSSFPRIEKITLHRKHSKNDELGSVSVIIKENKTCP